MISTPAFEGLQRCDVLLVYHLDDEVIMRCIDNCLLELSSAQLIGELFLVGVSSDSVWDNLDAVVISAGQKNQGNLWSLLGVVSDANKFDIFTIATEELDEESQLELAEQSRSLTARCEELQGSRIIESRVFLPEYGREFGLVPSPEFFTSRTANLIVLPVDQQDQRHMAVPVRVADAAFIWHVALEIVSLTCSWAGTADSRIGFEPVVRGVANDPVVKFVRSWQMTVRFGELRQRIGVSDELPLPEGLSSAPVPRRVLDSVDVLHPRDFRIDPGESEFSELEFTNTQRMWMLALLTLPKTVWLGLDQVKANMRDELVDDIVGENPWVGQIFDSSDFSGSTERSEAGTDFGPSESVTALPGFETKVWSRLVQDVLGMADGGGSEQAAEARRRTGSESFVILNRSYLTSDALLRETTPQDQSDTIDNETAENEDESGHDGADWAETEDFEELEELEEKLEEPEPQAPKPLVPEPAPTLLGALTQRFQDEADRCRMRRSKFRDEFENLTRSIQETDQVQVPGTVGLAPLVAVWLAIVSLTMFSPLHESLDLGQWLGPEGRLRLFVLSTAITVAFLLLPIKPSDPKKAQSFIVLSSAIGSLITATLLMFPLTGGFWMALGVIIGIVALGVFVFVSELAKRRRRQRATGIFFLVIYITSSMVVAFNLKQTGYQDNIAEQRGRIFFITIVVAIVTIIASTIVLTLVMKRILHLQGGWRRRADYLRDNARWEGEQLPILKAIRTNWLGSAVALDYIICNPYGSTGTMHSGDNPLAQPGILRLRVLDRQPPREAPHPGWLGAKYRLVAEDYQRKYGHEELPEQARQVSVLSESTLSSEMGGDPRWDFARRLRQGEFDHLLGDPGTVDIPVPDRTDHQTMIEIAPTIIMPLPVGVLGDAAARVGNIEMTPIWWWPEAEGVAVPETSVDPKPSRVVTIGGVTIYQTVRVDVSDPVLFSDLNPAAVPSDDWDGLEEPAGGDLLY